MKSSTTKTTAAAGTTELERSLLTLGLEPRLPAKVEQLHRLVTARHPRPDRSWSWELAAAYRQVLAAVAACSRAAGAGGDSPGRGARSAAPGRRGRGW